MKLKAFFFCFLLIASLNICGQNTTFILVRHAEKDISPTASKTDPELTAEGKQRAARLSALVKDCRPAHIFSTTFKRTIATATPTAESIIPNYRLQIQFCQLSENMAYFTPMQL